MFSTFDTLGLAEKKPSKGAFGVAATAACSMCFFFYTIHL
jgi:hypothetical protein